MNLKHLTCLYIQISHPLIRHINRLTGGQDTDNITHFSQYTRHPPNVIDCQYRKQTVTFFIKMTLQLSANSFQLTCFSHLVILLALNSDLNRTTSDQDISVP